MSPKRTAFVGSLAAFAVAVAATGGGRPAVAAPRGMPSITVYSGQHPGTIDPVVSAFERKTGIHVRVLTSLDSTLATQVVLQGSNSPADVFVSENSPALEDLEQRGLLAPLAASTLAATPPRDNSATGLWVGVAAHASLLVYNTGKLKPSALPTSILGLADPEWHGELALAPNETDFQPIVIAVAAREGQAKAVVWLDGVRDNAKGNVYSNNAAIVAQVNAGRAALAVIDPYYWYALRDEVGAGGTHSAVRLLAPGDPGYIVDVSGAGVLKSSRHQVEAQRFVAFMVSREGQQALTGSASYEYPLAAGVASPRALLPWAKLRPDPITPAGLGTGQVAVTLLQQVGLL